MELKKKSIDELLSIFKADYSRFAYIVNDNSLNENDDDEFEEEDLELECDEDDCGSCCKDSCDSEDSDEEEETECDPVEYSLIFLSTRLMLNFQNIVEIFYKKHSNDNNFDFSDSKILQLLKDKKIILTDLETETIGILSMFCSEVLSLNQFGEKFEFHSNDGKMEFELPVNFLIASVEILNDIVHRIKL